MGEEGNQRVQIGLTERGRRYRNLRIGTWGLDRATLCSCPKTLYVDQDHRDAEFKLYSASRGAPPGLENDVP